MSHLTIPLERKEIVLEDRLNLINPEQGSGSNYLAGFTDKDWGINPSEGETTLHDYCSEVEEPKNDHFLVEYRCVDSHPIRFSHIGYLFEDSSGLVLAHRLRWDDIFEIVPLVTYLQTPKFVLPYSDELQVKYFSLPEAAK